MAVARSYEKFKIIGEPFEENKRMYVMLENGKKVRWYTDSQRAAMDKKSGAKTTANNDSFSHYKAFGFAPHNFITVFRGEEQTVEEWASPQEDVRFATFLGWYAPCTFNIENLPSGITPIRIYWDVVKADDQHMRDYDEISEVVNCLVNGKMINDEKNRGEFQGVVGQYIKRDLKVTQKTTINTRYGISYIHTMEDNDGNKYVWNTATKNYPIDHHVCLNMRVKEHKQDHGIKQTVVYYCKEVA